MPKYRDSYELSGCGSFIKYSLFFINLAIFIGSLVCLFVTYEAINGNHYVNELLDTTIYKSSLLAMLVASIVIGITSCCGCFGALNENRCYLYFYFLILFIFFIVMIIGTVLCFLFNDKIHDTLENELKKTMDLYGKDAVITDSWDKIQTEFKCCGVSSSVDWAFKGKIPVSCLGTFYENGCLSKVEGFVKDNTQYLGIGGAVIGLFTLLGMIFSCALSSMI